MENMRKRQGKQHKNTRSTFEVGSKAGNCVPPENIKQLKKLDLQLEHIRANWENDES